MKWFRYERDFARRWKPALYDRKPPASDNATEVVQIKRRRGQTEEVYHTLDEIVARNPPPQE